MWNWLQKAAGAVGNAFNQGASFAARPYQQTFNQASNAANDARRRLLEQQRAAQQLQQQAQQRAQQQAQINAQRIQQAIPKLNLGAAMSAIGKIGNAANPANQFKMQAKTLSTGLQKANQFGLNQAGKNFGFNPQQVQDLQRLNPNDRAKAVLSQQFNSVRKNPMMGIINSPLNPMTGLNQTYRNAPVNIPKPDLTNMVDRTSKSIARSEVGKNPLVGFVGDAIVRPLVNSPARWIDASTGQQQYSEGTKGLAEGGTDAFNMASLLYTPVKAGATALAIKQGGLRAGAKFIPGAAARGFGSGVGVNALYQASEKGINNIDAREALMAGGITGLANAALPFAPGVLKAALGRGNHVAPKLDFNAPQVAKNLAEKGRLQAEGFTNVKVAKIAGAPSTPSPSTPQNFVHNADGKFGNNDKLNKLKVEQLKQYQADQIRVAQASPKGSATELGAFKNTRDAQVEIDRLTPPKQLNQDAPQVGKTDPLIAEARKYKSADEFVKSHSPVYRGGKGGYDASKATERGVSTTTSKENAQWFAGGYGPDAASSGKTIQKLYLSPDAKTLDINTLPKDVLDGFKKLNTGNTTLNEELALVNYARKNGYDAINLKPWDENEIRVINPEKLQTKQQLTDLYNQAHTPQPKPEVAQAKATVSVDHTAALKAEALKYKSADEFVNHYNGSATQYGDYNPEMRVGGIANGKRLNEVGINPNKEVTIYRGIDDLSGKVKRQINDGDFVTADYDSALAYTGSPKDVVSMKVKAKNLITDDPENFASDPFYIGSEYIYSSKYNAPKPLNKQQLTDLYNQAHAKPINELAPEPNLPKGWKVNKEGEVLTPQGKVATPHDIENMEAGKVLSKKEITNFDQKQADLNTHGRTGAPIYETAPKPNVSTKTRGFVKTVKASEEVSDDVKKSVSGTYTPKQNSELVANADKFVKSKNAEKVLHDQLATKAGNIDDQTIANAVTFAKKQDTLGNHDAASNIYDQLSEHLTQKGREIQAASLLSRRTPEGLQFSAQRLLKKSGVEMTPVIKKEIQANVKAIKATKLGTEQRELAIAKMKSDLMKHIPQGTLDNLTSTWKAGLLSGVKTQGGNALSNSTFGIMKLTSNPVSAVADKAMSLFTGKRKFALTDRGLASGGIEGAKKGAYTLKTGIDTRRISGVSDKYEQFSEINFKNKWVNKLVGTPSNLVFRGMSAADQPYYYAALKNSLYDQALAEGKNQGLKGTALRSFMKDKVKNADNSMVQTAVHDAEKAILGFDTVMSRIVSYAHKSIETAPISEAGKQSANATINAIAPFTKVPSAFLSRTVDYTPFGPIKTIIGQVSKKQFDQRALSQAIGEGVTGTGLIVLGSQLARADLLSGDYPKTDQKEQARWKAEGITQNSVKIGPNWVSLNYLGPLGLLFGAGKSFVDAEKKGASAIDTASSVVAGFGSGLLQQSFLQGLSGFINALNEPGRFMNNYVKQFAGSVVPSWINDIGNLTDKYKRQSTSIPEATMARVPGLRTKLKEQTDVFGNKLEQGGFNTINPFKPSPDTSNTLTNELDRLAGVSKEYNVWPTPPNNSDFFGKDTKVDYNQIKQIQADLGAQIQTAWQETMASQDYMSKDDRGKVELLTKVKRDITDTFKQQNASKYGQTITPKIAKVAKPKAAKKPKKVATKKGRSSRGRVASITKSKQPKFKSVRIARGTAPKISKTPRLKLRSYT